jgi:hypothetical protein
MNSSSTGKIVAALVFTGLVGLVVWGLTRAPSPRQTPPSLVDGPTPQPRPTDGLLGSVEGSVFQSFDPETGRLRYELRWSALDPVGQGRYELTEPVASFFQGDTVVRVEAAAGQLLWPSRDAEPESGSLRGAVVVEVREDGGGDDPSTIVGTLETEELFFQSVLGELNAPQVVRIEAPGVEFEGRGLTVRVSEVQRRLQYLRVNEHLGTTIWPDRLRRGGSGEERASGETGGETGGAEVEPGLAEPRLIDLYRITVQDAVRLAQGGRGVSADEVEVWVRLRDRGLAEGAIAPLVVGPVSGGAADRRAEPAGGAVASGERDRAADEPIRFTSAGLIEIVPLAEAPSQLAADDLATRFRATSSPAVELRDEETGARVRCGSLQWGFGSRRLAVRGVGGALGVEFDFPGEASVRTGALDVDLAAGIGAFPGAGRVEILAGLSGSDERTTIEWTERADVVLDTSSAAARRSSTPLLRWLTASGEIEAETETAVVTGDFLRADFVSRVVGGEVRNDLNRVSVQERARAVIADGEVQADIAAGRLDVLFSAFRDADGAERIAPSRASALGNAVAVVNGDRLSGESVDAVIVASADGGTRVQSIDASGEVTLRTREGIDLVASTMHASEETGTLTLVGYPATVGVYSDASGRGVGATEAFADGFSITGESIRFDRGPRRLTVFGGGVLSYATANEVAGGYDTGSVRWQRSMRFDDQTGSAEFAGGVTAESRDMFGAEYHLEGERLALALVPDLLDERARQSARSSASDLEAVLAIRLEAEPGAVSLAEGRAYSGGPGATDRVLETAARLTGEQIILQRDTERLLVPGPGRLVFEDRRQSDEPASDAALATDGRGTTVFDWSGSLDALRSEGRVVLMRDVRMRHRHLGADSLTVVETERLIATIGEEGGGGARSGYVLEAVEGEGAVLASYEESQVVADRLSYSREAGRVIASALAGNRVTFFDAETGRHLPAERVTLDLATGRWRIEQAGAVTTPLRSPD